MLFNKEYIGTNPASSPSISMPRSEVQPRFGNTDAEQENQQVLIIDHVSKYQATNDETASPRPRVHELQPTVRFFTHESDMSPNASDTRVSNSQQPTDSTPPIVDLSESTLPRNVVCAEKISTIPLRRITFSSTSTMKVALSGASNKDRTEIMPHPGPASSSPLRNGSDSEGMSMRRERIKDHAVGNALLDLRTEATRSKSSSSHAPRTIEMNSNRVLPKLRDRLERSNTLVGTNSRELMNVSGEYKDSKGPQDRVRSGDESTSEHRGGFDRPHVSMSHSRDRETISSGTDRTSTSAVEVTNPLRDSYASTQHWRVRHMDRSRVQLHEQNEREECPVQTLRDFMVPSPRSPSSKETPDHSESSRLTFRKLTQLIYEVADRIASVERKNSEHVAGIQNRLAQLEMENTNLRKEITEMHQQLEVHFPHNSNRSQWSGAPRDVISTLTSHPPTHTSYATPIDTYSESGLRNELNWSKKRIIELETQVQFLSTRNQR